jgi:hypothetical protein
MASRKYPTEDDEQIAVLEWAGYNEKRHPELVWLHHIPNGGSRNIVESKKLQKMGVKPGVSDLFLPSPRGRYCGLYIEMKKIKGGVVTDDQEKFLKFVSSQGYKAVVCRGAEEAIKVLEDYLR